MAKKETLTSAQIVNDIKKRKFSPVYVLMGEESYYIDYISDMIMNTALTEDEKDFNLTIFYGLDSGVRDVISACKRYPAMAQYQVIIVREAQMMKELDMLHFYAKQPLKSTILVICNKNGNIKAPEFMKVLKNSDDAVIFESAKVSEANVGKVIQEYIESKGCSVTPKASSMLKDFVGTDVARIVGEIDKLTLLLNESNKVINPELIEKNIGISKDYNNFELENALREKNALKAMKIIDYFEKNPRNNPTVLTVSLLFSFFSSLLLVQTSKNKTEQGLMAQLGTKSSYRIKIFMEAARCYSATACVNIIGYLREFDAKSKGIDSRQNEYALLRELIFKILQSR